MSLSWNEVRDRAIRFSRDWSTSTDEERDKQTFWNAFFDVFGVPRRSVATFEHAVANARGSYGFLDLFWPGVLLVEHKSRGASLAKAESQAFSYVLDLVRDGRHDAVPRYIVLCDFARVALYDLEPEDQRDLPLFDDGRAYRLTEFALKDLHRHARDFAFIKGEKPVRLDPEDPANLKATQLLANLHDALEATGYTGHALERTLVRLLFCLFAEDSGIYEPGTFTALVDRSRADGRDLGPLLNELWDVLNTAEDRRQTTLDEDLAAFPYVNGGLFAENLPTCAYNTTLREALIACCRFHWARISPAVFGSLFQGVMEGKERRQIGAHYTSERDILKLLRALFLDELRAELDAAKADRSTNRATRLRAFQKKLRRLRLFDPACGCGNFLILAYRELRRLENETLTSLHTKDGHLQAELDVRALALVDVDQFYGLEIGEWPARIAEVGLWLQDHQCNVELAELLGQTYRRLPLKATPTIRVANALRTDWREFLPPTDDTLVLGNPPFVGKHLMDANQEADMGIVWGDTDGAGFLDYVTAWYRQAALYIQGKPAIRCAFVSTNSITQGEQAGILWSSLFQQGVKIHFAHRTFSWMSEAKGKAHVHVVIVGFGLGPCYAKRLYDYEGNREEPTVAEVRNISPYLIEGSDLALPIRRKTLCKAPEIVNGSKPADGGNLIIEANEYAAFVAKNPQAKPFIKPFVGAEEFLNGIDRWVLWLVDAPPSLIRDNQDISARIEAVRAFRMNSKKESTKRRADRPALFDQIRQPVGPYILIPAVSSERRRYVPIGFLSSETVPSNLVNIIPDATLYHFGVITSAAHMAWMRVVTGRLKSDYRYSNKLVYNNYPWPEAATEAQRAAVEKCAQAVLDARARFPNETLAALYDPLSTPSALAKAHADLDRAVDRCYRAKPFASDRERVEHLFALYEQLTAPLAPAATTVKPKRSRKPSP
ncbi:MAG: DNA methyltransferase [Opitutaceae bacterium]|jgi:hypothetical protein